MAALTGEHVSRLFLSDSHPVEGGAAHGGAYMIGQLEAKGALLRFSKVLQWRCSQDLCFHLDYEGMELFRAANSELAGISDECARCIATGQYVCINGLAWPLNVTMFVGGEYR